MNVAVHPRDHRRVSDPAPHAGGKPDIVTGNSDAVSVLLNHH